MASSLVEGPRNLSPSVYDTSNLFTEGCASFVGRHLSIGRSRKPLSGSDAPVVDALLREGTIIEESVFLESCLELDSGSTSETSTATKENNMIKPNLRDLFLAIVEEVSPWWKEIGRCLLEKEFLLSSIDEDYNGVREKVVQVFVKWHEKEAQNATVEKLCKTLVHMDCYDAIEKLTELEPTLSPLLQPACPALHKGSTLHNVKETYREFRCEKCFMCGKLKMVHLWHTKSTQRKYIVKALEDSHHAYALRKVIDPKALQQRKKNLRKMSDMKENEKMANHLLRVVEKLQAHINDHWNLCQQGQNCGDCDKSKLQQDLIAGELTLLSYQLKQMTSGRRRISLSGICHERIYQLAERTYSVCEEHKKMHQVVRRKSCASLNELDSTDDSSEDELIGPIQCTLNILVTLGRRRPTTQSCRKKNVKHQKLKKTRSNESTSTFYVPSPLVTRHLFPEGEQVPRSYQMASEILKPSKTSAGDSSTAQVGGDRIQNLKPLSSHAATEMKSQSHPTGVADRVTPEGKIQNRHISSPQGRVSPHTARPTFPRQRKVPVTSLSREMSPTSTDTFFRRLSQHQLKWNSDVKGSVQV